MAFLVTAITGFLTSAGIGSALAASIAKFSVSALLNIAVSKLTAPKQQDQRQALSQPTSTPPYRFVYGFTRAAGTPVPARVRDGYIYGCWLLNSRPSDLGDLTLYLDKRAVTLTGDPFNFAGAGATAVGSPFASYINVWFGRGDQTTPPADILTGAPWAAGDDQQLFLSTDGWRGRTVMWAKIKKGKAKSANDRWPNRPPQVEVEAKWSRVWDPRDAGQNPAVPSTWLWSDNQSLCLLDALRQNPIEAYSLADLWIDTYKGAADIADELVTLLSGGTEKRYRAGGTLVFENSELEDQLRPLLDAGGARFLRAGGQLGITPGAYITPSYTLTDLVDGSMRYRDMMPASEVPTEIRTSYTSAARGYEVAELAPWPIPGSEAGLPRVTDQSLTFVQSATQAMRLRKIKGLTARQQRFLSGTAPPSAFVCVAGTGVTVSLPSPYSALNGQYEAQSINPGFDMLGDDGVAMRCPVELRSTSADVFAWAAANEEAVIDPPYIEGDRGIRQPGTISATTGPGVNIGTDANAITRIRFAFGPAPDTEPDGYRWEYRDAGGDWTPGGTIGPDVRDGSNKVFGFLIAEAGKTYDIRVLTFDGGDESDWRELIGVLAVGPTLSLGIPTGGTATGGVLQIVAGFTASNTADHRAVEFWGSNTNSSAAATLLATIYCAANSAQTFTETGLGASVTRYYFGRSRGPGAAVSSYTASVNATTAP